MVLSGNHRWNAFKKALREYPQRFGEVTKALREQASSFGLDPATIAGDEMVGKVIPTPGSLAELERIASDLNQKRVQEFTRKGDIANRATRVTPELAELVSRAMDRAGDGATVRAMLDSAEGPPLIRRMIEDRIIPKEEAAKMVAPNGLLTPDGKTAVLNALTGKLLKGVKTTDKVLDNVMASASALMRADEAVPRLKAIDKIREAAEMVAESKGSDVAEYFNQGRLDGRPRPSQNAIDLAVRLKKMGSTGFSNFIKEVVENLAKSPDNPLFGEPPPAEFPTLAEKPIPRRLKTKPGGAEVRDQVTGEWRPYDAAKDGPAPTMKDSSPSGLDVKQNWMNPDVRERIKTGEGKAPPPVDELPKDDGHKKYERSFTSEEEITPERATEHLDVLGAKFLETTDGFPRRTNVTKVLAEPGIAAEDMIGKDYDLFGGGKTLDKLFDYVNDHPGSELIVSKMVRGEALTAAERQVLSKSPAEFQKLAKEFGHFRDYVRVHDIPLKKAAASKRAQAESMEPGEARQVLLDEAKAIEERRWAVGDLGPNYFPWSGGLTWGKLVKIAKKIGIDELKRRIKFGNLDFSREGFEEPKSNSVGTAMDYVRQVREKQTMVQAGDKLLAAADYSESIGWKQSAKIFRNYFETHIKKARSEMDADAFGTEIEKMIDASENNKPYFKTFEEVVANKSPASHVAGWHNSIVSAMTVAFNLSSALTAGVGNTWRVASETGLSRFAKAAGKALEYATSKAASKISGVELDPKMKALEERVQRLAGLEDAELADITGQESGFEMGGKALRKLRQVAYQHVRIPDVVAKFIAVIDQMEAVREEHPSWSNQRVETEVGVRVAGMTDVSKPWTRAQAANHPFYKLAMLFSKSGVRETTQMIRQLNGGPTGWAKLAKNVGGRVAMWGLIYKMASGSLDKDKVMTALARVLPFSFLWENRAPPVGILPQKIYKAATGEPEALLPSAVQQKSFRKLLERKKR